MRRLIVGLLVLAALAPPTSPASAQRLSCNRLASMSGRVNAECGAASRASIPGRRTHRQPIELIGVISARPAVGPCLTWARAPSDGGRAPRDGARAPAAQDDLDDLWGRLVARFPACPSVAPREVAFSFLRHIVPPGPDPWIAPGYAITGKRAFVETRGPTTVPGRHDTPLGPLDVTLRATTFVVDWGDGSGGDRGPFSTPGRPWPDGAARHTFTVQGRYDVTVTQSWDAEWRLGGESGVVRGLSSVDRLAGFEARQLQAVRNR